MAQYLSSNNIKMFPSAYREQTIDQESYFTTEGNLTKSDVLGFANKSFVESDGTNITIVIDGYRFDTTISAITSLFSSGSEIWAGIYTSNRGTSNTFKTLVPFDNTSSTILDTDSKFKGLAFGTSASDVSAGGKYLKVLTSSGAIPSESKLNISASQIVTDNTESDRVKSIREKIVTNDLVVENSATISGNLSADSELYVEDDATFSSDVSIAGDVNIEGRLSTDSLRVENDIFCDTLVGQLSGTEGSVLVDDNGQLYARTLSSSFSVAADTNTNIEVVTGITQDSDGCLIDMGSKVLRNATSTQSGIVSETSQTFGGLKTFAKGVKTINYGGNYGSCTTAGATQIKVVTISNFNTSNPPDGTSIFVRFSYYNSHTNPLLRVSNGSSTFGDYPIVYCDYDNTTQPVVNLHGGEIYQLVFYNNYWRCVSQYVEKAHYANVAGKATTTSFSTESWQGVAVTSQAYDMCNLPIYLTGFTCWEIQLQLPNSIFVDLGIISTRNAEKLCSSAGFVSTGGSSAGSYHTYHIEISKNGECKVFKDGSCVSGTTGVSLVWYRQIK